MFLAASINDTTKFRTISEKQPKRVGRPLKHYHPLLQKEKDLHVQCLLSKVLPAQLAKKLSPSGSRLAHLYGLPTDPQADAQHVTETFGSRDV